MNRHHFHTALFSIALVSTSAVATDWSECAARACRAAKLTDPQCHEQATILRTAMDAAKQAFESNDGDGADGGTRSGQVSLASAASAVAAYVVLERFHPEEQPGLEVNLAVMLADIPESQAKARALAAGRRAGESVLARRGSSVR